MATSEVASVKRVPLYSLRSTRFIVCLLMMFGLATTVSMRVNLSMAMVCMVNSTAFNSPSSIAISYSNATDDEECPNMSDDVSAAKAGYTGKLLWSPSMQSLLFSATFYGALATTAFSGYMADRFGPKMLLLAVALDYVIVTLLTPVLTEWSYEAYFVGRVLMGLGEGFSVPCMGSIASKWFTANEKTSMAAIYTSGNQIAIIAASVISAGLCSSALGWQSIFYLFGCLGIVWIVVWSIMFSNHPIDNKYISEQERNYLNEHVIPLKKEKHVVPWRSIATSTPLWAAVLCQFTFGVQNNLIQSFMPTYLKEELHISLKNNGFYTTIPFIGQLVSKNILAAIADYLKRNEILSHTNTVKVFQSAGSLGTAVVGFQLAYLADCHSVGVALWLLGAYGFCISMCICGFFTALLSIAPLHSGTIVSISMVFGSLGSISAPMIVSLLNVVVPDNKWMWMFNITGLIPLLTGIFFLVYGSADVQYWAKNNRSVTSSDLESEIDINK